MKGTIRRGFALAVVVGAAFYVSGADAACISGGAVSDINDCLQADQSSSDCLLGFAVDFDGAGGPPPDEKKIVCKDGDPCDRDGHANGVCTFDVGVCVNPGATGATCAAAANLTNLDLKKPGDKDANKKAVKTPDAFYARRSLLDEIGAGLGAGANEVCSSEYFQVRVPLKVTKGTCAFDSAVKCTHDQECDVDDYCIPAKKKGKAIIKATVDDGGAKDSDSLKFFCLPQDVPAATTCAETFQIASSSDLIGGPIATGRVGDWMIRNGQLRTIIKDVGRDHAFMLTFGGHVMDADLVRDDPADDRDNWQGLQTMINISNTQNTQSIGVFDDGSTCGAAILETSGPDDLFDVLSPDIAIFQAGNTLSTPATTNDVNLPVNLTTRYILRPDTSYVTIATTVENTGGVDLELYVGDYLNGGGLLESFGPGLGFGQPLLRAGGDGGSGSPQGLDYIAYQGAREAAGVTYGVIFPRSDAVVNGKTVIGTYRTSSFGQAGIDAWVDGANLVGVLNASADSKPPGTFVVPAGGTNTFRRFFAVGSTVNDITKAREELFGTKLGIIQGTVTAGGVPVAGARIALINESKGNKCAFSGTANCVGVFSATVTDEQGFYRAWLEPATYNVQVRGPGYPYEGSALEPADHVVVLKGKKTEVVDVDLPTTGGLRVLIEDQLGNPIAGRVSIVGFEAAPDPMNIESIAGFIDALGRYFGYEIEDRDAFTPGVVRSLFVDQLGDSGVENLEPGQYHVVVSHGYEYDVYDEVVNISSGATTTVNATVNHVIDTAGFVSIDTHVHMVKSPDSNVSLERRVVSMLAEGVDFFAPTDHDFLHDIGTTISAMGVGSLIASAPGAEHTTFSYGHFNMWPQAVNPASRIGGAFDWGDASSPAGLGFPSDGEYDVEPSAIFGAFTPATQVVQINHFNSPTLGHMRLLGIDTEAVPPQSAAGVYRCSGGSRIGLPCQYELCSGGSADGTDCGVDGGTACTSGGGSCLGVPVGRGCPGGTCDDQVANLSSFLRMDPSIANLYDDGYTALEVWIESTREQTDRFLHDNLGDWAGLLNQGLFKTGVADSDTHSNAVIQAGGPRSFVASATDDPGSISAAALALNVNAGRVIGTNGPFLKVTLTGDAAATASHALGDPLTVAATGGAGSVDIHVESPTWAEYDRIEVYVNTAPDCVSTFNFMGVIDRTCDASPTVTLNKGVDFVATPTPGVSGSGTRNVTDVSVPLTITSDTWVIVVVRGRDNVSKPLFPIVSQDLAVMTCNSFGSQDGDPCVSDATCGIGTCVNKTLSELTDGGVSPPWNLNEEGALATAFSNPLFFDFQGDGLCHGGVACP